MADWAETGGRAMASEDSLRARFEACFDDCEREEWLDRRWRVYLSNRAWIEKCFGEQQGKRDTLRRAIWPEDVEGMGPDDDVIQLEFFSDPFEAITETVFHPSKSADVFDRRLVFGDAPQAVASYLKFPAYQSAKGDTFFIRYAVNHLDSELQVVTSADPHKPLLKSLLWIVASDILLFVLTFTAITSGWNIVITGILTLLTIITVLGLPFAIYSSTSTWRGARKSYADNSSAHAGYKQILDDLNSEAYDSDTISRRLQALESRFDIKVPAFVFTLLNMRKTRIEAAPRP